LQESTVKNRSFVWTWATALTALTALTAAGVHPEAPLPPHADTVIALADLFDPAAATTPPNAPAARKP
jgi:hypothetical protein